MSNLQISLLGIGAVVIAGVYAFNKLQERKYRRLSEKHFESEFEDVLLQRTGTTPEQDERIEPRMAAAEPVFEPEVEILPDEPYQPPPPAVEPADPLAAHEIVAAAREPAAPAPAAPAAIREEGQPQGIDETICYVAEIHAGDPIAADALAPALQQGLGLGKPVYWFGLNHRSGLLEEVDPGTHAEHEKIRVALQLADRNGHATEAHLGRFCDMVQSVAGSLMAIADCPEKQPALQRAKELDDFCAEVDVLIGLNVVSRDGGPFPGTKIRALAEAGGMKLQPDGSFHYVNDAGVTLFTLANYEAIPFTPENAKTLSTHGVTLLLDVPKVAGGVRVFNQMVSLAKQMAHALGGILVDDNRKPLSDAGIDRIKQQLGAIYGKMDAHQIVAGSVRALRLFS